MRFCAFDYFYEEDDKIRVGKYLFKIEFYDNLRNVGTYRLLFPHCICSLDFFKVYSRIVLAKSSKQLAYSIKMRTIYLFYANDCKNIPHGH